jgi:putative FmdB family regulatory protein
MKIDWSFFGGMRFYWKTSIFGLVMPIYEYRCHSCGRLFQKLLMNKEEEKDLRCPVCLGSSFNRLISKVSYHASERDRMDSYRPGERHCDSFYTDSRNIGLHAKKRAQEMGVDLGSRFEEKLEKLRTHPGSVFDSSE